MKLLKDPSYSGDRFKEVLKHIHNNTNGTLDFLFKGDKPLHILIANDEIWFHAYDISYILGYDKLPDMYKLLDKDDILVIDNNPQNNRYISPGQTITEYLMQLQRYSHIAFISLSALFKVILNSNTDDAIKFRNWYNNVLICICNHGSYLSTNIVKDENMRSDDAPNFISCKYDIEEYGKIDILRVTSYNSSFSYSKVMGDANKEV